MLYRAAIAAVLATVGLTVLSAQPEPQRVTFKSSLDMVSVAVVVRGPDGRVIPNLDVRDFEVLDRGRVQPITQFQRGSDVDARVALLIDSSGSMALGARQQRSQLATEFLIERFRPSDAASVFSFDARVQRLTPFTNDRDRLKAAVMSVQPYGLTGLYDAIVGTVRAVTEDAPRARAVLLLTDGIDNGSVQTPVDAASAAAAVDLPLYVLSVANDRAAVAADEPESRAVGSLSLQELAARTGGMAVEADTVPELRKITGQILNELRHQYVLAFPAGSSKGWHELTVRVRRGRIQARSRNGYLVS